MPGKNYAINYEIPIVRDTGDSLSTLLDSLYPFANRVN
jgi:hypothetical protein